MKSQNECVAIFTKLDVTNRKWKEDVDVRDFIQKNYKAYEGDKSFLSDPTEATNMLWGELQKLQKEERRKNGVLDMETEVVSSLTSYPAGYIKEEYKDLEQIVGLQTDKPLKRAFMPYGGIKMAEGSCKTQQDYHGSAGCLRKRTYRRRLQQILIL